MILMGLGLIFLVLGFIGGYVENVVKPRLEKQNVNNREIKSKQELKNEI